MPPANCLYLNDTWPNLCTYL